MRKYTKKAPPKTRKRKGKGKERKEKKKTPRLTLDVTTFHGRMTLNITKWKKRILGTGTKILAEGIVVVQVLPRNIGGLDLVGWDPHVERFED